MRSYTIVFTYRDADRHLHKGAEVITTAESADDACIQLLARNDAKVSRIEGPYLEIFETATAAVRSIFDLKAATHR